MQLAPRDPKAAKGPSHQGGAAAGLRTLVLALLLLLATFLPAAAQPSLAEPAFDRAQAMLADARVLADQARRSPTGCDSLTDVLVWVVCSGKLYVGLRPFYPGFSVRHPDGRFTGMEADLARDIARFMGVEMVPVAVEPQTRFPALARWQVDLAIATVGHDAQRDAQVTFIQPYYYASRTIVVGPVGTQASDWSDLRGQTACVPIGASSNLMVWQAADRVLLFDSARRLVDALNFGRCRFIVHDDSFFAVYRHDPHWNRRYDAKFGFAPIHWGMVVARTGTERWASLLSVLSLGYTLDGTYERLARAHRLDGSFAAQQQARWSRPPCLRADGLPDASCFEAPSDTRSSDPTTSFATNIAAAEDAILRWVGLPVDLSPLKNQVMFDHLWRGVVYSAALAIGCLVTTAGFALLFARLLNLALPAARRAASAVVLVGQTTPMPLLMFLGYVIAGSITHYTGFVGFLVAILVLGFYNGANAGRAIAEARRTVMAEPHRIGHGRVLQNAIALAWSQIAAFTINAAKGTPAAEMIGVPEFLGVLSDLAAYTADRTAAYVTLLIFYSAVVLAVIALLSVVESKIVRHWGQAHGPGPARA